MLQRFPLRRNKSAQNSISECLFTEGHSSNFVGDIFLHGIWYCNFCGEILETKNPTRDDYLMMCDRVNNRLKSLVGWYRNDGYIRCYKKYRDKRRKEPKP